MSVEYATKGCGVWTFPTHIPISSWGQASHSDVPSACRRTYHDRILEGQNLLKYCNEHYHMGVNWVDDLTFRAGNRGRGQSWLLCCPVPRTRLQSIASLYDSFSDMDSFYSVGAVSLRFAETMVLYSAANYSAGLTTDPEEMFYHQLQMMGVSPLIKPRWLRMDVFGEVLVTIRRHYALAVNGYLCDLPTCLDKLAECGLLAPHNSLLPGEDVETARDCTALLTTLDSYLNRDDEGSFDLGCTRIVILNKSMPPDAAMRALLEEPLKTKGLITSAVAQVEQFMNAQTRLTYDDLWGAGFVNEENSCLSGCELPGGPTELMREVVNHA